MKFLTQKTTHVRVYLTPSELPAMDRERLLSDLRHIAEQISRSYRHLIAIDERAQSDRERFVFKGSVIDSPFQKSPSDQRFYHRNHDLNAFYSALLTLDQGDEACQVGHVSWMNFVRYFTRSKKLVCRARPLLSRGPI